VIPDTIFGALSFTRRAGDAEMLQRDTNTQVFQAPKILALDGREATIFVGETVRWAEAKTEQGQAGGLSLSLEEASNSPVEDGFQLLIVPARRARHEHADDGRDPEGDHARRSGPVVARASGLRRVSRSAPAV
jgi:hypothetical protein